jgi:hypothetical protein
VNSASSWVSALAIVHSQNIDYIEYRTRPLVEFIVIDLGQMVDTSSVTLTNCGISPERSEAYQAHNEPI